MPEPVDGPRIGSRSRKLLNTLCERRSGGKAADITRDWDFPLAGGSATALPIVSTQRVLVRKPTALCSRG